MESVREFVAGRDRVFSFLVGQVMKETKGTAAPEIVNELLRTKIEQLKQAGKV